MVLAGKIQERVLVLDGFGGNGPLDPTPKFSGTILSGNNPVAVDLVSTKLMGFDYKRIPLLYKALEKHSFPIYSRSYDDIICITDDLVSGRLLSEYNGKTLDFKPHFGWLDHI